MCTSGEAKSWPGFARKLAGESRSRRGARLHRVELRTPVWRRWLRSVSAKNNRERNVSREDRRSLAAGSWKCPDGKTELVSTMPDEISAHARGLVPTFARSHPRSRCRSWDAGAIIRKGNGHCLRRRSGRGSAAEFGRASKHERVARHRRRRRFQEVDTRARSDRNSQDFFSKEKGEWREKNQIGQRTTLISRQKSKVNRR